MSSRAIPTFGTRVYNDYVRIAGSSVSFDEESFTWTDDETGLVATWNGNWLMRPEYPEFGFFDPWNGRERRPPGEQEVPDKYDDLFSNPYLTVEDVSQAYLYPLTEFLISHLDILDIVTQDTSKPFYEIKRRFYEILKTEGVEKAKAYIRQVNPYASIFDWLY